MIIHSNLDALELAATAIQRKRAGHFQTAKRLYETALQIDTEVGRFRFYPGFAKVLMLLDEWRYAIACLMIATEVSLNDPEQLSIMLNHLGHAVLGAAMSGVGQDSYDAMLLENQMPKEDIAKHLKYYKNAIKGLGSTEVFKPLDLKAVLSAKVQAGLGGMVSLDILPPFIEPGLTVPIGCYYFNKNRIAAANINEMEAAYVGAFLTPVPKFGSNEYFKHLKSMGIHYA